MYILYLFSYFFGGLVRQIYLYIVYNTLTNVNHKKFILKLKYT